MTITQRYEETIPVPRAIRFPVELIPPDGFDPARLETWPKVEGRLEYVKGRLLYMPPCGQMQSYTVSDVVAVLVLWVRAHPEFVVGTNETTPLAGRGARSRRWHLVAAGCGSGAPPTPACRGGPRRGGGG